MARNKPDVGRTLLDVEVGNYDDVLLQHAPGNGRTRVRKLKVQALVDTGSALLCLPAAAIRTLGLHRDRSTTVRTANGVVERSIYRAAQITILGRHCLADTWTRDLDAVQRRTTVCRRRGTVALSLWLGLSSLVVGCRQPAARIQGAEFRSEFAVDKADLADQGANPYFILRPGHRLTFQDGKDTLTITVLDETRLVDGVRTRVVEERETKRGQLAEVSRNYFAIHKTTKDVYYFGEDVDDYKNGKVVGHGGGWLAGEKGAKFGLMMPGTPKVGDKFYQEQAPKVAMDRAEIVSLDSELRVPAGLFKAVLCVKETSALEAGSEKKWYAPGVGLLKDGDFELAKVEGGK